MFTENQQKILKYTERKVKDLLKNHPVPAHGIGHVLRVTAWAEQIAKMEKEDIFLVKMAAILHDVGRTKEKSSGMQSAHWALSYEMCKDWFVTDPVLKFLSKKDKDIILYAVRYHWNDAANRHPAAWILRDADKMDGLGTISIKRAKEFYGNDEFSWQIGMRLIFSNICFIRTKSARKLIKKYKMMEPVEKAYKKFLCSKLEKKF
ncbi:MAG: HD domain-containing protein [Patescibacteria group bacterium]